MSFFSTEVARARRTASGVPNEARRRELQAKIDAAVEHHARAAPGNARRATDDLHDAIDDACRDGAPRLRAEDAR